MWATICKIQTDDPNAPHLASRGQCEKASFLLDFSKELASDLLDFGGAGRI